MALKGKTQHSQGKSEYEDKLGKLIKKGKEKGTLTYQEISKILPQYMLEGKKLDALMATLDDKGIKIVDESELKEEKGEVQLVPISGVPELDTTDSIKMYLSEMGKVPLLSRDEEMGLAKAIKE